MGAKYAGASRKASHPNSDALEYANLVAAALEPGIPVIELGVDLDLSAEVSGKSLKVANRTGAKCKRVSPKPLQHCFSGLTSQ